MMQEVRCMKLVRHPNIVRLYEVIDTQTKLFLILELGDYDMYEFIMKRTAEKGVKEAEAQKYFSQIIKAIDYCHTLHVVHRDLKLENVVFFESLGMVKLTDFGFSNLFTPGQQLETSCGSLAYSAPEILLGDAYDAPAVDVWSLGVLLYMLVIGRLPFQETNDSETLTKILDCKYSIPDYVSQSCKQLISRMLVRDPEKRATLHEIVQSPWVTAGDRGLAEALPLIVRDHLPDSAHTTIIEQMVAGGIGTEDEILGAIEEDEYNYMTATYYLLAERVLSSYREEQAQRLLCNGSNDIDDAIVSEAPMNGTAAAATSSSAPVRSRSRSNSWRGPVSRRACTILKEESEEELSTYLRSSSRQSSRNSSPSVSMFHAGLTASRDRISPQAIHDLIDFTRLSSGMRRAASPDSRYSSRSPSPPNSSGRTSPAISGIVSRLKASSIVASSGGMRKLSSSPHLLGICEESEDGTDVTMPVFKGTGMVKQRSTSSAASTSNMRMNVRSTRSASTGIAAARLQKSSESSFDGLLPPQTSRAPSNPNLAATYSASRIVRPRQAVVSPDMLRRYDTQRFLHKTRRSTSCSSSETSEDEDRRLNLIIGSKYCKRDSDQDPKPDDDPPR
ncbi:CAMK/CAMKL/SNRK protein kinase, partial [Aphelenchoides avenae]